MAESKNNVVMHGASGKVDLIVFSQRHGKTVISKAPAHSVTHTPAQDAVRQKFQQAVIYARAAIADAAKKQAYKAAAQPGQSAYNVALADFFNAPDIQEIDVSGYTGNIGDQIKIAVTDNFKVAGVAVSVHNGDGTPVEAGNAVQDADGLHWIYTATAANASLTGDKITVTATDAPQNETTADTAL
ncbi:MAG: hypothetical protein QM640_03420 [Niabella sp.]